MENHRSSTSSDLAVDLASAKSETSIHPMLYGYLRQWLISECNRSNNGQISSAMVRAKLKYLDDAKALAYASFNVRERDQLELL